MKHALAMLCAQVAAATLAATLAFAQPPNAQPSRPSPPAPSRQANAQPSGPPNALQGFSQNRDQPVKIDSATLEVRDKDKVATFAGDVHLVQGDTTMKCNILVVFYEQDPKQAGAKTASATPAAPAPGSGQQIRRIEAKGNVIVTQKDQVATGDNGVFEMRDNKVTLIGNVVISQGPNVVKGERLVVDMTTGVSKVEGGRVQALFQPSSAKDGKDGKDGKERAEATGSTPAAGAKEPPKAAPLYRSGLY